MPSLVSPAVVVLGPVDNVASKPSAQGRIAGAICNLLGADEVSIHLVDLRSETMKPVPGWERSKPLSVPLRDFLMQTAGPIGENRSGGFWYDHGNGEETLSVVLGRRNGRSTVILCDFSHCSPAQRAAAARLVPEIMVLIGHHVEVQERLHRLEIESAAAIAALDHGECGIIALAAKGAPVFVNAAARDFLEAGRGLHVRRGEIRLSGYAESIRFRAALEDVADTVRRDPTGGARTRALTMFLPQEDGSRPVLLVIAPAMGRTVPGGGAATALLYIVDSQQALEAPIAAVCRLHGLSLTETGLIAHLVGGLTLSEAAAKMRIKVDTARTYLKQIFAKTGTHRQVDLVALISRYSRAVRGEFDFQPA